MPIDPRDEIWKVTFETYYDAYYQELLSDRVIHRWQRFDEITKTLVAITASGSAISGWALWNDPEFKILWGGMAGFAALLGIIHTALHVPERLKDHGEIKRRSASLRADLETFRYRMRIDPDFPVDEFTREFVEYRKRFSNDLQLIKNDILLTMNLANKVQEQLNVRLRGEYTESG